MQNQLKAPLENTTPLARTCGRCRTLANGEQEVYFIALKTKP
jgi:hypothetical protein